MRYKISDFDEILCDDIFINQDWVSVTIIKPEILILIATLFKKKYKRQIKDKKKVFFTFHCLIVYLISILPSHLTHC